MSKDAKAELLDSTLTEVLSRINKMAEKEIWSKAFVAKCLLGFEYCLRVMDADYETIDSLTLKLQELLPEVSMVTDSKIIERFGKAGRNALYEVD